MGLPTWGMLRKSQTDPEKIEEAIDRIKKAHNENPEAHLGPGQALQSHKMSEIIDHRAESVVNDKIHFLARAFTAIVEPIAALNVAIIRPAGVGFETNLGTYPTFTEGFEGAFPPPDLTFGGNALPIRSTLAPYRGSYCLQFGAITHNQVSWVEYVAPSAFRLSFWWRVSSESFADFLRFSINGIVQFQISGGVDWENRKNIDIPAGSVLRWEYIKNASGSVGLDSGWLDEIVLPKPGIMNWENVCEVVPDGDTSYVFNATGEYRRDLYSLGKVALTGAIKRVRVYFRCLTFHHTHALANARASIRTHGAIHDGFEEKLTDGWETFMAQWDKNPTTGKDWTWEEINSLEAGVSLRGEPALASTTWCTQVFVEVLFGTLAEGMLIDIPDAIDFVRKKGGGKILVTPGIHIQEKDVSLYDNISLVGIDNDACIIDFNNREHRIKIIGNDGLRVRNISIENLTIRNSTFGLGPTYRGMLYSNWANNILVDKCIFRNSYNAANSTGALILFDRTSGGYFLINNCYFDNINRDHFGRAGISVGSAPTSEIFIQNCLIKNCWRGIDSGSTHIHNCQFLNNRQAIMAGDGVAISSCLFQFNIGGIDCGDDNVIDGNIFWNNGASFDIQAGLNIFDVVISNNVFRNFGAEAIDIDRCSRFTIIGNVLNQTVATGRPGIHIRNGSFGISVIGNHIIGVRHAGGDGIRIADSDRCIVNSNRVVACVGWGINIFDALSEQNIITSNILLGNTAGPLRNMGTLTEIAHNINT